MDATKAQRAWVLPWHSTWVTSVAFAGSSNRVVAGNKFGQILVWDLPKELPAADVRKKSTGDEWSSPIVRPSRLLSAHDNYISRLIPAPDGRILSASWDHTLRAWNLDAATSGESEVVLYEKRDAERAKRLGKTDEDIAPAKLPVQSAAEIIVKRSEWIRDISLNAGNRLLVGDDSGKITLYESIGGKTLAEMQGGGWIRAAALSPDGKRAVTTEYAIRYSQFPSAIRLWDTATGKEQEGWADEIGGKSKRVPGMNAAAFSPDGSRIGFGKGGEDGGGPIYLAETETGKLLWQDKGHPGGATRVAFSADGKHLLTAGRDTTVRVYSVADGKLLAQVGTPRGGQSKDWAHDFALSPDESRLAMADMAGLVHIWQL